MTYQVAEPHIRVEYDKNFCGGDYSNTGDFALIKLSDVDVMGGVEKAFKATMNINPIHIIHYSEDDLYDADGNLLE